MSNKLCLVFLLATVTGCAASPPDVPTGDPTVSKDDQVQTAAPNSKEPQKPEPSSEPESLSDRVEKILTQPSEPDSYADERRCLPLRQQRTMEVIDSQRIAFKARGQIWLTQLSRRCPGLNRHAMIQFESRTGRLCTGDRFQVLERGGVGVGTCFLGRFTTLDDQQLEALKGEFEGQISCARATFLSRTFAHRCFA